MTKTSELEKPAPVFPVERLVGLSEAQKKVLRSLHRSPNRLPMQISGYGAAPYLSAARALVRKGLVYSGAATGHYGLTDAGRQIDRDLLKPNA